MAWAHIKFWLPRFNCLGETAMNKWDIKWWRRLIKHQETNKDKEGAQILFFKPLLICCLLTVLIYHSCYLPQTLKPGSIKYISTYIISGFHIYFIIGYDFDGKLTTCNESDSERLTSCLWPTVTAAAVSWL